MYCHRKISIVLFVIFLFFETETAQAQGPATPKQPDFPELQTSDGKTYTDCYVKKVEPDALTIKHSNGMARISFFSLSEEIQSRYNFDPIIAAKKASSDESRRRDMKWKLFWENQEYESEKQNKEAGDKLYTKAKTTWIPVQASILKYKNGGAYVRARKFVMVPTTTKSKLGFINPGPPEKKLVPFNPELIFIENPFGKIVAASGQTWNGYVESFSTQKVPTLAKGNGTVPVHRAMPHIK